MKIRHNWPNILFLIKRQLLLPKILKFIHAKIHQAGSSFFIIFNVHRFDFAIYIIYVIIQIISCAYWLSQWLMLESIWISWIQYLNLWNEFGAKRKITAIPKENMIFFSHSVYVFLFVNAFWFRQFVISRFKKMQTIWGDDIILDHFLMVLIACIWQLTIKITLSYVIRGKTPLKLINQLWPSCGVMIVKPHQSLMVTTIDLIFFTKLNVLLNVTCTYMDLWVAHTWLSKINTTNRLILMSNVFFEEQMHEIIDLIYFWCCTKTTT